MPPSSFVEWWSFVDGDEVLVAGRISLSRCPHSVEGMSGIRPVLKILGSKKNGSIARVFTAGNRSCIGLRMRFVSRGMTKEGTRNAMEALDASQRDPMY